MIYDVQNVNRAKHWSAAYKFTNVKYRSGCCLCPLRYANPSQH